MKNSENNNEIDANTIQCIESLKIKIDKLSKLSQQTKIVNLAQAILQIYMNDLLSITNCLNIFSTKIFQDIFLRLNKLVSSVDLQTIFQNDPTYARTIFYQSFDLLKLSMITDFLQDESSTVLSSHIALILRTIIDRIDSSVGYILFAKNSLEHQLPTIRSLIQYVDRNKHNSDNSEAVDTILRFVGNLVDNTILVPALIEAGLSDHVLIWISFTDLPMNVIHSCLHIIYDLARHEYGVKTLNDVNCLAILKDFKQRILNPNQDDYSEFYTNLRLLYCMILSSLTEPKENREDLDKLQKTLDLLMQFVVDAGKSDTGQYGGFHVSEPLIVLTKLFVHDEILKYVLNESKVVNMKTNSKLKFICYLTIKFRGALAGTNELDQLTLTALLNLLWSVSFHSEYVDELKSNSKFLLTVKSLANDDGEAWVEQYVPKYMSIVPKAANGILFNLQEFNPGRAAKSIAVPGTEAEKKVQQIHVMVSYCHADKDICRQIVEALQKDNHLHVWVDFIYCHSEDLWEEIAEAIEKADVILFLMSKDYQDSKSCRQEVMYSKDSLKKRFIPIYTKKDFVATGWLGVRIVGPQYIRFGKKSFDETAKELIKLIASDKKEEPSKETKPPPLQQQQQPPVSVPIPSEENDSNEVKDEPTRTIEPPNKPIREWTKKDINSWFQSNQIQRELADLCDFQCGTDLLLYRQCLQPNWQIEYNDMRKRYEQKYETELYRAQFVRFVGAIDRLQPSSVPRNKKPCVIS